MPPSVAIPISAPSACYYLAFRNDDELRRQVYPYAYRPAGGPHVLAGYRNVYGDANALFRTAALRSVGGYEIDRDTSWEDLEVFVKLVHAGHCVDVLPDYLFYYRHLESGWSRVTSGYLNHQRVLRQLIRQESLPLTERIALWNALVGLQKQNEHLRLVLKSLRYRLANRVHALFELVAAPEGQRALAAALGGTGPEQADGSQWQWFRRRPGEPGALAPGWGPFHPGANAPGSPGGQGAAGFPAAVGL